MISPSEQFVLQQWLYDVHEAECRGFTRSQAHALAELKRRWRASAVTEYPAKED